MELLKKVKNSDVKEIIDKFGVDLKSKPHFIVAGLLVEDDRKIFGIFGSTDNEFHAHYIKSKLNKDGSNLHILRTEFNPNGEDFNITNFLKSIEHLL